MTGKEVYENCIKEVAVGSLEELSKFLSPWEELEEIDRKFWEDEALLEGDECKKEV